ncbi:BatD family protein [Candidatus Sumerlaeota bacterium]|nr:BatD family protein [Candidatus Sumerlaeota bacterium]
MTFFRALQGALVFLVAIACAQLPAQTATPRPLPPGITVTASVSNETPVIGDQFQYIMEVTGNVGVDSWKDPDLAKVSGMRVRSNAEFAQQMEYKNGRSMMTSSRSTMLEATDVGKFTIPPGQIKISGIWYATNEVTVIVGEVPKLAGDLAGIISARTSSSEINSQLQGKYFALAETPTKIYRGQAVPVDIYIYRVKKLPSLNQWQILPDQNDGDDFVRPNVRDPRMQASQLNWETVKFGGQDFERVLLYTQYIVPTKTGKLRFTPPTLQVELPVTQKGGGSRDPLMDMMMNFQRTVSATLSMRSVDLDVLPVPDKPGDALLQVVGRGRADVTIDRQELPQRELLTLKISLVGNGFFDLISQPKAPELSGFSLIDTKSNSRMDITKGLLFSDKSFEYIYQAADAGEVTIPSFSFAFFNPADGNADSQNVMRSDPLKVVVTKSTAAAVQIGGVAASSPAGAAGSPTPKAGAKVLGSDVSYIDVKPLTLAGSSALPSFYLRPWFWFAQFIPFVGALAYGLTAMLRRNRRGESDEERARKGRRAAEQALKETRAKLNEGSRDEFYATLSRGVVTYIASLLGRSPLGLTNEEAELQLTQRGNSDDALQRLRSLLTMCDTIRYSPAADTPDARRAALANAERLLVNLTGGRKS